MKRTFRKFFSLILLALPASSFAQGGLNWVNADSAFGELPSSVHVYRTKDLLDGKPNIAYYVIADLSDKKLSFTTDTTLGRRMTPKQFYERNQRPAVVVNCTFFSFATNQNLNTVIKDGKQVGYTVHSIAGKGKDTLTYTHPFGSAIGISKKRKADVAWLYTDSAAKYPVAWGQAIQPMKDSVAALHLSSGQIGHLSRPYIRKWKMQTAVGGGPVLLQDGKVSISNNSELKFTGKAIEDKHPRTAMGYTKDNKLIILVVEGRNPGVAEGATLTQQALILQQLGCVEALNLDGGGSSCMLVNGKETIWPSDKGVERPVPAVFLIK
jgi:exopolysaccharide biosynthesis protein